jgi:hypothetical protein
MFEILMAIWKCGDVVITIVVPRPWKEISLHLLQFSSIYFTILFTSVLILIMFASEKHSGGFHGSSGVQQE